MIVQRNKMDVLTNNIANVETAGYKADTLVTSTFDEVMLERLHDPSVNFVGAEPVGPYSFGTHVEELYTDFSTGTLEETNRSTDLAIVGDAFFSVQAEDGRVLYTKSGNFTVNAEGYLTTQEGQYVLGTNGRIFVGSEDFSVSLDGRVTGPMAQEDTLALVSFEDTGVLRKVGGNLYDIYGGAAPIPAGEYSVRQRMLEGSNVSAVDEMVNMIAVYRNYEINQRIVSMVDKSLEQTVTLGRVGG
jgi:flagellar basal-body rod protein FlgG